MARPLLCVTVGAATTAELRRARDGVADADMVELRLDTVSDPDVAGALQGRTRPVVVTCRAAWEGGSFRGSEEERRRILAQALDAGADYVDIEWRAGFSDLIAGAGGSRVVLSAHDFETMPRDLLSMARTMRGTGAAVVKIAAKAARLSDCLRLLDVEAQIDARDRFVLIAMGERGLATRVLAEWFGSAWTYAGSLRGIGQPGADEMLRQYRFRSISEATELYGIVGSPVAHSVSPAMHNAAFAAANRDAVYLPLPAADVDDFLGFADAMRLHGASVTIPYKVPLFDRVQDVDPAAREAGAVNTLRRADGEWEGRNTDIAGFLAPLDALGYEVRDRRVAILGAGGSARSVAVALSARGAQVTVHARDASRAGSVAARASARTGGWPPDAGSWDVLVNCTPIGMHPRVDESPLPPAALLGDLVYDLVYNPVQTRLLEDAELAGCRTIGGLDMLVAQAVEQFTWWTGTRPDPAVMRAAAGMRLSEFQSHEDHVV